MKYINFNYCKIFVACCILSFNALCSCNNEKDEVNEWTANYVYLQKDNYLAVENPYNVTHTPLGINGDFTYTFSIKTVKPLAKDVTVIIKANSADIPIEKIAIPLQTTIKAGEISSEDITVTIPDWSFAFNDKAEKAYNITLSISDLQTADKGVFISDNLGTKTIKINKGAYSPVLLTMPANWQAVNRSGWEATASHIYDSNFIPANAIDDNSNSTWFAYGMDNNGGVCWLNIKLDTPINMVGFSITRENAYGGGYSVKQATIQIKKEGDTEWTTYKDMYTFSSYNGFAPQFAVLDSEIQKVKEFRLNILSPTNFTGLADLNIYKNK